ncbi:hypothetical protein [Paucibacter sp. XJ19-41]|uniref:hypothetical protein n=1 Tax=Paucibacter sp. XJ19-41 TaxID=2927824 RepID=UPI002348F9A5|nr:hypothetical protein [Paucibacter sp. XJ19-41]MDC6167432.1 hypothetical protein [Paucibacter sp. XJ19-41]
MIERCNAFCCQKAARRSTKQVKKQILEVLSLAGVQTNSKLAFIAPGWADQVVKVCIVYGSSQYKGVALYLVGLCQQVNSLTEAQKRLIESDPSPLSDEGVMTQVENGRRACGSWSNSPQRDLLAA